MSMYIATSEDPPAFVASNKGWADFAKFASRLRNTPTLGRLVAYGWTDDVAELSEELQEAIPLAESRDVKTVAETLLSIIDGAETVVVTDGVNPKPD